MRFFHNLPLKRKLTTISVLTSGIALLLACAAFITYEQLSFRREQARELEIAAHIIGANSVSSLSFEDNDSATITLKSLEQQPRIVRACLYDAQGKIFATYQRDPWATLSWPPPQPDTVYLNSNSLDLYEAVRSGNDVVGTIYLESDLDELIARRRHYLGIGAAVFFAAILLTWMIASRLQRLISEPITDLATVAGRVGSEKAYSIRATKRGDDEIGRLIDGFNHMLAQIEIRDAELKATHRDLERRVEERTRSLETASQELLVEKARFQFIFDHAPVGISLHSSEEGNLRNRMINEAHLTICGLTRADVGEDFSVFRRITHPDDLARQVPLQEKLERGEISNFSLEKRYVRPDGKTVWVVFTTQRIDFPNGRVEAMSTISDITALKEAELETAQQRERFKFIFDSLPVGVSLYSQLPQGGYSFLINDAQLEIIGVTRDEVMVDLTIFNRLTHPEDYERQLPLRQKLKVNEIDRYSLEKRYIRPDGETVWVSFYTQRKTYPNGRVETLSVVVDITGLKRAQEEAAREQARLKFIFDSVPVGISLYSGTKDNPRRAFLINNAHLDICGVTREQVAANEGIFGEITHPEDAARQKPFTDALNAGTLPRYTIEKRYIRPDGRVVWATFSAQRMVYPDGRVETLGTVVDITELKLAQEEAAREQARLKFIFDYVPVGICLQSRAPDNSSNAVLVNNAHLTICGVQRDQLIDNDEIFSRITHPEDLARQAPLNKALEDGTIPGFSIDKRYIRPDGSIVWVTVSAQRMVYPDGRVDFLGTVTDITALKRAQEEAAREQARFKFIFDSLPVGVSWRLLGPETLLLNPAHEKITGVSAELAASDPSAFARATHPDDVVRQRELGDRLKNREIDQFVVEKRYIHPIGRIVLAVMMSRV
jgi:PAS domain S-box-containing protein